MIRDYERKIVEDEIARLERAYRDAQERYGITGSASTDRTMTKYSVLRDVLEDALTGNRDASKDKMLDRQLEQLRKIRDTIQTALRARTIQEDVAMEILETIRG